MSDGSTGDERGGLVLYVPGEAHRKVEINDFVQLWKVDSENDGSH